MVPAAKPKRQKTIQSRKNKQTDLTPIPERIESIRPERKGNTIKLNNIKPELDFKKHNLDASSSNQFDLKIKACPRVSTPNDEETDNPAELINEMIKNNYDTFEETDNLETDPSVEENEL